MREKLIIYGAGKIGKENYNFLNAIGYGDCVIAFCDRAYDKIKAVKNISVISYSEVLESSASVLVSIADNTEILHKLQEDSIRYYADIQEWIEQNFSADKQWVNKSILYSMKHDVSFVDDFDVSPCLLRELLPVLHGVKRLHGGYCAVCERETIFVAKDYWLRDNLHCINCESIPRMRAVMKVLKECRPNYSELEIHESSPGGVRKYLRKKCKNYSFSFYYETKELGCTIEEQGQGCTNQNLEKLTFLDESFDIVITQDVFEHILDPMAAFKEIERVLKPGGIHIFTTPVYPFENTRSRIAWNGENLEYLSQPIYHGNPISEKGALVTYDWGGRDIQDIIRSASGMKTKIYEFPNTRENFENGLEGDFLYVFVSEKEKRDK